MYPHPCRLGKKLSYLLNLLNDTHSNTRSLVNNEISQPSNLYGVNLERYLPSGQLGPGQVCVKPLDKYIFHI